MSLISVIRLLFIVGSIVLITACGGGGSGGEGSNSGSTNNGSETSDSGDGSGDSTGDNSGENTGNTVDNTDTTEPNDTTTEDSVDQITGYQRPAMVSLWSDDIPFGEGRIVDDTIVFSGISEPNHIIEVWLNEDLAGSTIAGRDGKWHLDFTSVSLIPGDYAAEVISIDRSGNRTEASEAFYFRYDPTAPSAPVVSAITDDSYNAGDGYTTDSTLIISGTAEFSLTIRVFIDGVEIGTTTALEDNSWLFDHSAVDLPDGTYRITAESEVMGLVSAISPQYTVVVDRVNPSPPTFSGITFDSGSSNNDGITNDANLVLNGSAEPNAFIRVRLDGVVVGNTTADAAGNWNYDYQAITLSEGDHTVSFEATDRAGNRSNWSAGTTVSIDTVAPASANNVRFGPDTGVVGDGITATGELQISGDAEANAQVEVFVNGGSVGSTTADNNGNWLLDLSASPLVDGVHSITAQVNDLAGNQSELTSGLNVTVDTVVPIAPTVVDVNDDTGVDGDLITADAQLLIVGTAQEDITIRVSIDGSFVGTTTSDSLGNWSYDHSTVSLSDGVYAVTAVSETISGNQSPVSNSLLVTVDTTAPASPYLNAINTDTAVVGDFVSSDSTLIFTGAAEANTNVILYVDGVAQPSVTSDAAGNWMVDYSGVSLTEGSHSITLRSQDVAGNNSLLSATFTVIVDATAPLAPLLVSVTNDTGIVSDGITADNQLQINGTSEANATLEVFIDSVSIGTTAANAAGSWTFDHTSITLGDGSYVITAQASDLSGNVSPVSTSLNIMVDTTAPSAPVVTDISDDTAIAADGITSDNTLIVGGTAEPNANVEVFIDSASIGITTVDGAGNWSFNHSSTALMDGSYSITALATDLAANSSLLSAAYTVTVDSSAPVAPSITSITDDTATPADGITSDNTLFFVGTAEADSAVEVFVDGSSIGSTVANSLGAWSFDHTGFALADGIYAITAQSSDASGNVSALSSEFNVSVDATAPVVPSITSITDDTATVADGVTSDNTLIINGTAEANASVEVFVDSFSIGVASVDGTGNWSLDNTSSSFADNGYVITAQATDSVGNASAISAGYNITVDTVVPSAPSVASITTDTGNVADGITSDDTLVITGTAEPNASVEVFVNSISIGTATAGGGGIWSFDYSSSTLAQGDYTITAAAIDAAGNTSSISADFNISIDTTTPAVPSVNSVSDDTGIAADEITFDNQLFITGTAEVNSTVEVFVDAASIGTTTADALGDWTFDYTGTALADASYAITATASDIAANTSAVSNVLNITVDTDTPDIIALSPVNSATGVSYDGDLTISFDEDVYERAGNIVLRYSADDSAVETFDISASLVTGTGTAAITINPTANLYGGTQYYVEVDANSYTDLAGNNFSGVSGNAIWVFTTADTAVSSSTPEDEATSVPLNTTITLNFNETVLINSGNVRIRKVSDDSTVDTIDITSDQVSGSGTATIVITQSDTLEPNTAYYVEIDSGALVNGNGISFIGVSGNSTLNFTTINVSVPAVTNVTSSLNNGNYRGNDSIPIQVTFSEIVDVTGSPQIHVDLDDADKYINYTSGSGTATLQFDYVVTTGDTKTDLGYVSTGSLVLNGGTIRSANHANADLTLPSPGASGSLRNNKNINIVAAALDLTYFTSADGFIVEGYESNDEFGRAVGGAGDVNGDGYEDFIIGNEISDEGASDAGIAYVIFGKSGATRSNIDMSAFSAADGISISRGVNWENVGTSVFIGGDLNGDGYDEIIVTNPGDDTAVTSDSGKLYIVWGKAALSDIDMNSFTSSDGFVIEGYEASDFLGKHKGSYLDNKQFFDSEGDFNGDGVDDLLIGHSQSDEGADDSGIAYVIFGKTGATRSNLTLNSMGSDGFIITVDTGTDSFFGHSVEFIEDFNGDGYNDILIGAPHNTASSSSGGDAYVIFGHGGPTFNDIDMGAMTSSEGFQISVNDSDNWMGGSVSSADVNGDGLSDVLIAHSGDGGSIGSFGVLYGFVSATYSNIGWADIDSVGGYYFVGESSLDYFAHALEAIGDINGDGISDMLATSWTDREGGDYAGAAWVIYGESGDSRSVEYLSSLTSGDGFKVIGDWGFFGSGDEFGKSIAVGDVNGDGYDDLIISAPKGDNGGTDAGEVYVIWGKDYTASVYGGTTGNASANNLVGSDGVDTLVGNGGADNFSAGNGDDTLEISDLSFARIIGGRGTDTLSISGVNLDLDLRTYYAERFSGIEIINLNDSSNGLILDKLSLLMLSEEVRALYVKGGSSDYVTTDNSETWVVNGTTVVDTITYNRYDHGEVSLFVQNSLSQPATPSAPTVDSISDDTANAADEITSDNTLVFNGTSGAYFDVEVFIDGSSIGTTTADAAGNWSFDHTSTTLSDSTFNVTAEATNLGGYTSVTSSALTVVVDATIPAAPVIIAITNDSGAADGITSDTTLLISGTSEANGSVEVFVDGSSIGTTTANGSGNWNYDYTGTTLTPGSYILTAQARDEAGNTSVVSADFTVTIDTSAPAAPIVASITTDTGNVADGVTSDTTLEIAGTAEANAVVEVFVNGSSIGTTTAGSGGIWSFDHTGTSLGQGDHILTAQATDTAGNISSISADFNISIDTATPAAPTVDSITDDTGTAADNVTFDNQLLIAGTAEANSTVEVFVNAASLGITTADGAGDWIFDHTATTLADGGYAITATATDTAANTSAASSALNITVDADDPDINSIIPGNGATSVSYTGNLTLNLDEVVYETSGNIVLRYMSDDTVVETFDITGARVLGTGTGTITIDPTSNLYGGTQYYVEIEANSYIDLAGNNFVGISGNAAWAFTTADTAVSSSTPADEGTNVALNTTITLNFNEVVTVNSGNVRIRKISDSSIVDSIDINSGQVSGSGTATIVITQSDTLEPNTAYYVEIDSGALINGNNVSFAGISGNSTLNFTTANVSVPTVTNVTSSVANGNYNGNDTIPIQVTFSEIVNVTGTPQIYIDLDNADKYINYTSGTGTTTLQFDYTVTTGDSKTDLAYMSTGALVLNGGTIRSVNFANATLTLPAPGAANSLSNNKDINVVAAALDISNLTSGDGFFIEGSESSTVWFGHSINSGGDFNGDGFEDLVIGVPDSNLSNTSGGYAYLVYGKSGSTRAGINMSSFSASDGFYVTGSDTADYLGSVVDISGDLNGDGYNDFVVVSSREDDGASDAGTIYIIWGNATPSNVNVSTDFNTTVGVSNTDGFVILGTESSEEIGHYSTTDPQNGQFVDASGDFNGDGIQDLLIGHNQSDFGSQTNSGVAYLIFGKTGATRANFKLDTYGSEGFAFYNTSDSDNYVGHSVQYIGDFNGDGFNDVIIGAPEADGGDLDSGEAHVVFGNSGPTFSDVDLNALNGSNGFTISTSVDNSQLGGSVSSADVNGDGLTDILIGVPEADTISLTNNGAAIIIYGNSGPHSDISLESVGSAGYVINGENDTDRSGHSIRGIKDLNGDGIDDFVLSTIHDDEGGTSAGAAWVIYGAVGTGRSDINLSTLTSTDGFKIIGDISGDEFGRSATSGDINGDGYTDMMFSSVAGDNNGSHAGEVNVIWGKDFTASVFGGTMGNASANNLVGTDANDTLIGNGGSDNFSAGSGDDIIEVNDLSFSRINGGLGNDTLSLTGSGLVLSLQAYDVERFRGIEYIDLNDNGNGLVLDKLSLLMLSDEARSLYVKGGSSDYVATDGSETWTANGTTVLDTITYNRYDLGEVSLYVQNSLSQPATPAAPSVDGISDDTGTVADEITSDNTLIFNGITGAYYDVEVFIDGGSIGTTSADAAGNWSFDHTGTTLSDATYSVTAVATNGGGYASAVSTALTVVVDASAPAAPSVTAITNDSGAADGITNDTTLVISGTAEANSSVEVFIGGATVVTTAADGSGNWSYDHTGTTLSDGDYVITAQASDSAGNPSVISSNFNVTIDTAVPAAPSVTGISDDTGTADDGITADDTLIISGTSEANITVEIFIDAVSIGTTTSDGVGDWSFDHTSTSLSQGDYTITAQAIDGAGNASAVSIGFDITITSAIPTLSSSSPVDGATLVALDTSIVLNFSEVVIAGSGNITIHKSSDGSVWDTIAANSAQVSGSGTSTITINQNDVLEPGTSYYINIDGNAFANAGGASYVGISNSTDLNFSTINTSVPAVSIVSSTKIDGTYGIGELIQIQVQFSELVYVTEGTPTLTLDLDGLDVVVGYSSGSGSNTLVFDYTVALGDTAADLGYVSTASLSLSGSKIRSNNNANANLTLATPGAVGSLSYHKNLVIDANELDISGILSGSDAGFAVIGDTASARLGSAVANVGDVNGDGFEDFVAGAPNANDGRAYVIWGKAGATRSNIDLASFSTSDGFAILGEADTSTAYDNQLGISVGGVGDLNGDGFDDILVVAEGNDNSEANDAGTAYVVWGKAGATRADVDTASFSSSDGFRILGTEASTRLGFSDSGAGIASGGDFNGDGVQDLLIGHYYSALDAGNSGQAFLIFGKVGSTREDVILHKDNIGNDGFFIGNGASDYLGQGVDFVGDFNGDGYDDIAVGATGNDTGSTDAGIVYVIFGNQGPAFPDLDLSTLTNTEMFVLYSTQNSAKLGHAISSGDFNGDGLSDLLFSANYMDYNGVTESGAVFVIYGYSAASYPALEVETIASSNGYVIYGDTSDRLGSSVSGGGDFNADGVDDILVSAHLDVNDSNNFAGSAWIIFGVEGTSRGDVDLATLTSTDGFKIKSTISVDYFGTSTSQCDINGDGFNDLLAGASFSDPSAINQAGEVIAVWGYDNYGDVLSLNGDANDNNIVGTSGDDTISGGGGSDAVSAGSGDDTIQVADAGFFKIDGGLGNDTLAFVTSGNSLDLTTMNPEKIKGIERIDLGDSSNDLTLNRLSLLALSREGRVLYVLGGSSDSVTGTDSEAWVNFGTEDVSGVTFNRYSNNGALLYIETTVAQTSVPQLSSSQQYTFDTTVSGANVSGNVTDFPVLLSITDAGIIDSTQSGAPDIRFVDADGVTELPYEIERWDQSANRAEVWVLVPQVDGNSNTDYITMHFNDTSNGSVGDGQNPGAVWLDYTNVYHFHDGGVASGNASDSTANANDAIQTGTVSRTSRFVGVAAHFTDSDALTAVYDASFNVSGKAWTASTWMETSNCTTWTASIGATQVLRRGSSGSQHWSFVAAYRDFFGSTFPIDAEIGSDSMNGFGGWGGYDCSAHVTLVYDPNGSPRTSYFVNGNLEVTNNSVYNIENLQDLVMGDTGVSRDLWLDETRVTSSALSADYIKLMYENQKSGSTFVSP